MADIFEPNIRRWVDLKNPEPVDDTLFFEQRALELGTPLKKPLSLRVRLEDQENITPLANQVQRLKVNGHSELDVVKLSGNAKPGSYGDLGSLALLNPEKNKVVERARRRSQQLTLPPEQPKSSTTSDSGKRIATRRSGVSATTTQPAVVRQNSFVRRSASVTKIASQPVSGPITRRRGSVRPHTNVEETAAQSIVSKPVPRVLANLGPSQMTLRPRNDIIVSQRDAQRSGRTAKRPDILPVRRFVSKAASTTAVGPSEPASSATVQPVVKTCQTPTQVKQTRTSILREQAMKASQSSRPLIAPRRFSLASVHQDTVEKKREKIILPPPQKQPFGNSLRSYAPPTGLTPRKIVTIPMPFPPPRRSASKCRGTDPSSSFVPMSPRSGTASSSVADPKEREQLIKACVERLSTIKPKVASAGSSVNGDFGSSKGSRT